MVTATKLSVLDPTVDPVPVHAGMAPRPGTLDGSVVGLLSNGKPYAAGFLDQVHAILTDRFDFRGVVSLNKGDSSRPAPKAILKELAERCDVVITAAGD